MNRLRLYNNKLNVFLSSKNPCFKKSHISLKSVLVTAGLYKPTSTGLEYNLILSSLTGELSITHFQLHGKRKKRTTSLSSLVTNNKLWFTLDKMLHELLPRISEFKTQKLKKDFSSTTHYSFRVRHAFRPLVDFQELVTLEMLEKHKGVYLPLTFHFKLQNINNYRTDSENFLRMLRLPFYFYSKIPAPAFDDPVEFNQGF